MLQYKWYFKRHLRVKNTSDLLHLLYRSLNSSFNLINCSYKFQQAKSYSKLAMQAFISYITVNRRTFWDLNKPCINIKINCDNKTYRGLWWQCQFRWTSCFFLEKKSNKITSIINYNTPLTWGVTRHKSKINLCLRKTPSNVPGKRLKL